MTDMDARMADLRARFVTRAATDRTRLVAALDGGDLVEVRRLAHGLSGSGGVFGFPAVSEDAAAVEAAVDEGAAADAIRLACRPLLERLAQLAQGC